MRHFFICCHRDLPATQQIALALRIVSGLSVRQIARAFLVSTVAMEQRITRAKRRIATADVTFEAPGPTERAECLATVAAMVYPVFTQGYTSGVAEDGPRTARCEEAIRLARLLLPLFPTEPEIMGLLALMLLRRSKAAARFAADGATILLEDQDRSRWDRRMIVEGLALVDKAMRHHARAPISSRPPSQHFARAPTAPKIPTGETSNFSTPRHVWPCDRAGQLASRSSAYSRPTR